MTGSTMRNAAILWHVSLLVPESQKAIALGMVGLCRGVPIVAGSLVAGVVADTFDRRRVLVFTNTALLVISTVLATITLAGLRSLPLVYGLAALGAAFSVFDNPARNSFFPTLVPREDLPNAIGLNSIVFQTASVLGPMVGGLVIGTRGVAWVYAIDAGSFVVLLGMLGSMRDVPVRALTARLAAGPRAAWEGIVFVFRRPLIRGSMLLDFLATFFASATALLPLFAQDILHVGAHGYGLLASASAVGAVVTSLVLVKFLDTIERRGVVLVAAAASYGLMTICFGLSRVLWLSFACLFLAGAADMVSTVLRNVIRQLDTPDEMRGRMTSVNMIFFMGGPQLGEVEAGAVAHWLGPVLSVVSGGVGCVLSVLLLAWRTPALVRHRRETVGVPPSV
jgi:MFS family permease